MREYDFFQNKNLAMDHVFNNQYESSDTFDVLAIKFLAELLLQDDYLILPKFSIYKDFVTQLFVGELEKNIELREFLLKSLLAVEKRQGIVAKLVASANDEQITLQTREMLAEYALRALESCKVISQEYITAIDGLIVSFGLSRVKFAMRLDKISQSKPQKAQQSSFEILKIFGEAPMVQMINQPMIQKQISIHEKQNRSWRGPLKNIPTVNKPSSLFKLNTPKSEQNELTRRLIIGICELNHILKSDLIAQELENLEPQLENDARRIVITGEIKHGKSSLFNKILGQTVSPEGESTATTAAVVELFYSKAPVYEVCWMSQDHINRMHKELEKKNNNRHMENYKYRFLELVGDGERFQPGGVFVGERSNRNLPRYLCANGEFASGVEKVRIGNPLECLRDGAVLVDTPGLNDPIEIRNQITLKQAGLSDILIFVMTAEKLGTESERGFLKEIVKSGSISDLIVVVTHTDHVKRASEDLKADVRKWLNHLLEKGEAHQEAIELVGNTEIFLLDTRNRFDEKGAKDIHNDEFVRFIKKISSASDKYDATRRYVAWVKQKREDLIALVKAEMDRFLKLDEQSAFSNALMDSLQEVTAQLENLGRQYAGQVSARLRLVQQKHRDDYGALMSASERAMEATKAELESAIHNKIEELGDKFSDSARWRSFGRDIAEGIVSRNAKLLEEEAQSVLSGWPNIISEFKEGMQGDLQAAFNHFPEIRNQYETIAKSSAFVFSLCKTADAFAALDLARKRGTDMFTGTLGFTGIVGVVGTLASLNFLSALTPPLFAAFSVGAAAFFLTKATGILDKTKAKINFKEDKMKKVSKEIALQFDMFNEQVHKEFAKIEEELVNNGAPLYAPIIRASIASSRDLGYQIEIAKRVQHDMKKYTDEVLDLGAL